MIRRGVRSLRGLAGDWRRSGAAGGPGGPQLWPFEQWAAVVEAVADIQKTLRGVVATQKHHTTSLQGLIERTRKMASQQEDLNALVSDEAAAVSAIGNSLTGIQSDLDTIIQQLKDAQANNQPLDFTGLQQVHDQIGALAQQAASIDAENPAPDQPPTA